MQDTPPLGRHHTLAHITAPYRTPYSSAYIIHTSQYDAGHSAPQRMPYIHHSAIQDTPLLSIHHTYTHPSTMQVTPLLSVCHTYTHPSTMQGTPLLSIHHTHITARCRTLFSSAYIIHSAQHDAGHPTPQHTSYIQHSTM